jgi:hypothetical protein
MYSDCGYGVSESSSRERPQMAIEQLVATLARITRFEGLNYPRLTRRTGLAIWCLRPIVSLVSRGYGDGCPSSKLDPHDSLVISNLWR